MAAHYFGGDTYTPSNGFRGVANYVRTSAGVWLPAAGDTGGNQLSVGLGSMVRKDLTFSLDTSAYASGDLIADSQELTSVARAVGGTVRLESIEVLDEDDQGVVLYIGFADTSTSWGTENAAPSISDANAANMLGFVPVAATDYVDIGGAKVLTLRNIGLVMKCASASTSLWVGIVNGTGTPTFTAGGLKAKFSFTQLT